MSCAPALESPAPQQQIELTGNVRHANGRPAARATVFAKAGGFGPIYFENGQLTRFTDYDGPKLGDPAIATVETDDTGSFRVRVTPPLFTLFVMHESGTQVVTHDQYIPDISISLDAWATIRGEVRVPKVPTSEHSILMHTGHFPGTDGPHLLWHGEVNIDSEGRFEIDRVPANFQGGIRRVAQTTDGCSNWGFGAGFVTAPGEHYELNLGGRSVVGRLVLSRKRDDLNIQAWIHQERRLRRRPKQLKLRREVVIPSASDPYDLGLLQAQ